MSSRTIRARSAAARAICARTHAHKARYVYVLADENAGAATRVDLAVSYALTGALAQFSRSGIVQEIAQRMTRDFARNLETRLGRGDAGTSAEVRGQTQISELNAGTLLLSALWSRIKALFGVSRKN